MVLFLIFKVIWTSLLQFLFLNHLLRASKSLLQTLRLLETELQKIPELYDSTSAQKVFQDLILECTALNGWNGNLLNVLHTSFDVATQLCPNQQHFSENMSALVQAQTWKNVDQNPCFPFILRPGPRM